MNNKGFTLIELLFVLTIIIIIWFIVLFIIKGPPEDMECYYSTNGPICTFEKVGSDKE